MLAQRLDRSEQVRPHLRFHDVTTSSRGLRLLPHVPRIMIGHIKIGTLGNRRRISRVNVRPFIFGIPISTTAMFG